MSLRIEFAASSWSLPGRGLGRPMHGLLSGNGMVVRSWALVGVFMAVVGLHLPPAVAATLWPGLPSGWSWSVTPDQAWTSFSGFTGRRLRATDSQAWRDAILRTKTLAMANRAGVGQMVLNPETAAQMSFQIHRRGDDETVVLAFEGSRLIFVMHRVRVPPDPLVGGVHNPHRAARLGPVRSALERLRAACRLGTGHRDAVRGYAWPGSCSHAKVWVEYEPAIDTLRTLWHR